MGVPGRKCSLSKGDRHVGEAKGSALDFWMAEAEITGDKSFENDTIRRNICNKCFLCPLATTPEGAGFPAKYRAGRADLGTQKLRGGTGPATEL